MQIDHHHRAKKTAYNIYTLEIAVYVGRQGRSTWYTGPPTLMKASSTAQGGGGSFKNKKPKGEVGCCESRMAEGSGPTDG
jgi:hypothetical protein